VPFVHCNKMAQFKLVEGRSGDEASALYVV